MGGGENNDFREKKIYTPVLKAKISGKKIIGKLIFMEKFYYKLLKNKISAKYNFPVKGGGKS